MMNANDSHLVASADHRWRGRLRRAQGGQARMWKILKRHGVRHHEEVVLPIVVFIAKLYGVGLEPVGGNPAVLRRAVGIVARGK